ncbi:MAG TPA: alpha/beta fold hydrolase [Micromonosporaceae bacterium]|nr:alpha/beta fold hydrolase [Micromonosporaceae bacterium]
MVTAVRAGAAGGWLAPGQQAGAAVRVFCLPHAGGGASVFRGWLADAPPGVEVCPVQLPGRESRYGEDPPAGIVAMVPELARAMLPFLDAPFALVGNSMGGLIAYELARHLLDRYLLSPVGLVVAGIRPPGSPDRLPPLSGLCEAEFGRAVQRRYGGIPPELVDHPDFVAAFLPVLRADMAMVEHYRPTAGPPLPCPITAMVGAHDHTVGDAELRGWGAFTTGGFEVVVLDGDHFAMLAHPDAVLRRLAAGLGAPSAAGRSG